ncbi:MAG: hypothetical protein LBE27_01990, partial [Deltaproteobacteria bacterium]|nr:hypothetical protein [Deltaproteobacteria bacterium]
WAKAGAQNAPEKKGKASKERPKGIGLMGKSLPETSFWTVEGEGWDRVSASPVETKGEAAWEKA